MASVALSRRVRKIVGYPPVDPDSWQGDLRTVESVKALKNVTVATFGAYRGTEWGS